jgi:hypothetical protein
MGQPRASKLKGWLVTAGTAAFVVGAVYAFTRLDETPEAERPKGNDGAGAEASPATNDVRGSLRDQLLHSSPGQLGVIPVRGVWGVLMERGYAKGVATVVALADGTASMYTSTGAAATGGKAYAPARMAALHMCQQAADSLAETIPASAFPAPAKGRVRFYVLATGGVRVAEGDVLPGGPDAGPGAERLAPLLAAGDSLLDRLKEATNKGLIR